MKYAILGLSLVCLAMGAWATASVGDYGIYVSGGAGGLVIFVAILTFIVYGGGIALEKFSPNNFFRIGFLIGYIFSIIFWLSGWAWSASVAGVWNSYTRAIGSSRVSDNNPYKQLGAALAVCAALGAVVWVMAIVNLVMFIKACVADENNPNAELGNIKHQADGYPAAASYPAPAPAQPYGAQPQAYPQTQTYPQQPAASPYGQAQPYATQ